MDSKICPPADQRAAALSRMDRAQGGRGVSGSERWSNRPTILESSSFWLGAEHPVHVAEPAL